MSGNHFDLDSVIVFLFNNKKQLWEDKSTSIDSLHVHSNGRKNQYHICFKGSSQEYSYSQEKVNILHKIKDIAIDQYSVFFDDKLVHAIKLEEFQHGFYRVYKTGGYWVTKNITLIKNNILKYYWELSAYAGKIFDEEHPLFLLSKKYEKISPQLKTVLIDYCQGILRTRDDNTSIIVPFDFNQSQIKAIERVLCNNISIIEGPPGTGKTQTILNLITNIVYRGMNCAVVSNNNTAIHNVYEKLEEEGYAFIMAHLGGAANVERFFEADQNKVLFQFLEQENEIIDIQEYKPKIDNLHQTIKKIQDAEVDLSRLELHIHDIKHEKRHHDNLIADQNIINTTLSSKDYMQFMIRLGMPKKTSWFERWRLGRKFKIKIAKHDINLLLHNAEKLYYQSKISELLFEVDAVKNFLFIHNKEEIISELKYLSHLVFQQTIKNHYTHKDINFDKQSYKKNYDTFIHRYPVVLSTLQSLVNNTSSGFLFDYLIIDEASQGDLLSSVLSMACAKRLVVVGDSKQLQQIDEAQLSQYSEELAHAYNIPKGYRYDSNSILNSISGVFDNVPTTLLKEHYRCVPAIINFCNKMFYDGELIPMTRNTGKHIEIIKTVPGNHARKNPAGSGLYNQREIDEIVHILSETRSDSIGIISPFRCQADRISDLVINEHSKDKLESDTVHKFQGRQKEEVILSFVVNALDKDSTQSENRLYDFITNEQLMNVAISRGRNKVTIIVSDKVYHTSGNAISNFIKYAEYLYGSGVIKESTITSVFDHLYSEYSRALLSKYKNYRKLYKTELLMCNLIDKVLMNYNRIAYSMHTRLSHIVDVPKTYNDDDRKYILHPWTHVDFLFYNKITKESLFVLEVDGVRYHEQNKKQSLHDDIKNKILALNNISIYRFKTNESNEAQRLVSILEEAGYN